VSTFALAEPQQWGHESTRELSLLMENFARFIGSDSALYYRVDGVGRSPAVVCSWTRGVVHGGLGHPRDGGLVGRALHSTVQRAALEPRDPPPDQ
jgi:hypothetical protein